MRCVNCNNDMKVKKDAFFKGRCSNCGHEFAITHPENGISDARVQGAITRISDNGKLYYLPSHTEYEIRRGQRRKSARRKWYVLAALILLCVVAWLIFWMDWVVFGFIVGAIAFVALAKGLFQSHEPQADLRSLIERFEDINPPSHSELAKAVQELPDDLSFSADTLLICEDDSYVNFLLANNFHLQNACPVIGKDGYGQALFPDILDRARQTPEVRVFVLHHLSPAGLDFVRDVRHSKEWFGEHPGATVIDLGLSPGQKPMVESLFRPLSSIPGRHRSQQVPGLPLGYGADLGAFRPELLLVMLALGLEGGAAMALPLDDEANQHDRRSE